MKPCETFISYGRLRARARAVIPKIGFLSFQGFAYPRHSAKKADRGFSYSAALRLIRPEVAANLGRLLEPAATEPTPFDQRDRLEAEAHEGDG